MNHPRAPYGLKGVLLISAVSLVSIMTDGLAAQLAGDAAAVDSNQRVAERVPEPVSDIDLAALEAFRPAATRAAFLAMEARFRARARSATLSGANASPHALMALALFYAGHDLWPEAARVMAELEPDALSTEHRALAAFIAFRQVRMRDVLALTRAERGGDAPRAALIINDDARILRAAALARLGAYDDALTTAQGADWARVSVMISEDKTVQAALLEARAMVQMDAGGVGAADARGRLAAAIDSFEFDADTAQLLRIQIEGDMLEGARAMTAAQYALEKTPQSEAGARLVIAAARRLVDAGALDPSAALAEIEAARLAFSSAPVRRDAALALGELYLDQGDVARGLRALRLLTDQYPQSVAAEKGRQRITDALPQLFAKIGEDLGVPGGDAPAKRTSTTGISPTLVPAQSVQLFIEFASFVPPGAEGDALIRDAARYFADIGLMEEADRLLAHQAFERLRGAARARVAADLAERRLNAGMPDAALDALVRSRFVSLDGALVDRRLTLEARALAAQGRYDRAIALLEGSDGPQARMVRADLFWRAARFSEAGGAYAALIDDAQAAGDGQQAEQQSEQQPDAPRDVPHDAFLRAGLSYLLAGEPGAARALLARHGHDMNTDERALIIGLLEESDGRALMQAYHALTDAGA